MQILDRAVLGEAKCFKEKVIFIRKIGVDEKTIKNDIRRRACSQKVASLTQISLCTSMISNSIYPSWFLMKPRLQ